MCFPLLKDESANSDYNIGSYSDESGQMCLCNVGTPKEGGFIRCFPEELSTDCFVYSSDRPYFKYYAVQKMWLYRA